MRSLFCVLLLLPAVVSLSCGAEAPPYQPPSCVDGSKNGDEVDVDCGGSCVACAQGKACAAARDCASGVCQDGACRPGACGDGVKNGDETDVDCGGACPACATGALCGQGSHCASGVCTGSRCQAPTCTDRVKNGAEIDADCGGPCAPCGAGKACVAAGDCASGVCQGALCQAPSCTDRVKNGDEIDADCGGSCGRCAFGKACGQTADCDAGVCDGSKCRAPLSCAELLRVQPATKSGVYRIDPDGAGVGKADFAATCEMTIDGGGWTRFNWVREAYPSGQDPLGQSLDECDPAANICRGRIPTQVTPTALLVRELTLNQYAAWRFDANNTISNGALNALRGKQTICQNNTGVNWQPYLTTAGRTYCGNGGEGGCDSFYYLEGGCNGKPGNGWGLQLDGDTGCANAAFKMGSTSGGCGASGGTDDYGFLTNFEYKQVFGEIYYR